MEQTILNIENLNLSIENNILLNDFNLSITKGQRIGITGPSGCGKSTLIKSIINNGFPKGSNVKTFEKLDSLKSSYIPQNSGLLPWFSLQKNIDIFSNSTNITNEIIKSFNLKNSLSNFPHQLSGGEYQRATLLTAIVNNPNLFIADEPLTELDISNKWKLLSFWSKVIKMNNSSLLLVSHEIETLLYLCDRVIVLSDKPTKTTKEIEINIGHPRTIHFLTSDIFTAIKKELLEVLNQSEKEI